MALGNRKLHFIATYTIIIIIILKLTLAFYLRMVDTINTAES